MRNPVFEKNLVSAFQTLQLLAARFARPPATQFTRSVFRQNLVSESTYRGFSDGF
jgi:hypothetical protein